MSRVCAVAVDVSVSVIAVITIIVTMMAIISVAAIARWLRSVWHGPPWQRGTQGLSGGSTHAASSSGGGKRVGGLDAGYPAKALGVARSDLEHCADLQATLRPEKSTSGVLSLSFIGSVFYFLADQRR
jgi:hypothetical protein